MAQFQFISAISAPITPPVPGCTDPAAVNYNPLATVDDGSCTYSPYSTPATNFFTAHDAVSGVTVLTTLQKQRIDAWFQYQIDNALLTNLKAAYFFTGDVENSMRINAKTLGLGTFFGGWTWNRSGAKPNGSTGYFKTGINPKVAIGVTSIMTLEMYLRSDNNISAIDLGAEETGPQSQAILSGNTGNGLTGRIGDFNIQATEGAYDPVTKAYNGHLVVTRESNVLLKTYRNGDLINTTTTSNAINIPDREIYAGAYNNNGAAALFSDRQMSFIAIRAGSLTAQQVFDNNVLVEGIQDSFKRGVQ
jgi:hypothetical protein